MNAPKILVTRELDELSEIFAKKVGLDVVVNPVIRIEFHVNTKVLAEQIADTNYDAIAFTSQNAVKAFSEIIFKEKIKVPQVKFYAIGDSTARHLKLLDIEPFLPKNNDAVALSELILKDKNIRTVLFPCAEHHLEDLPEWLKRQNVQVRELICYSTILLKNKIEVNGMEGIVFMSPSAVKSFFSVNKVIDAIPIFTIGRTTADEVRRWTTNSVVIANRPDVNSIFEKVMEYFSNQKAALFQ